MYVRRQLHKVLTPPENGHFLRMGNKQLVRPLGYCATSIRVGGDSFIVLFTVLPHCITDVILGCDFVSATGALIDCGNWELHSTAPEAPEPVPGPPSVVLCATENYMLPPYSPVAVTLSMNTVFGLLEPIPNVLFKKKYFDALMRR